MFYFYSIAEKEQSVTATLTDGQDPACSFSLYVVQIQMSVLSMCVFFLSRAVCLYVYMTSESEHSVSGSLTTTKVHE